MTHLKGGQGFTMLNPRGTLFTQAKILDTHMNDVQTFTSEILRKNFLINGDRKYYNKQLRTRKILSSTSIEIKVGVLNCYKKTDLYSPVLFSTSSRNGSVRH